MIDLPHSVAGLWLPFDHKGTQRMHEIAGVAYSIARHFLWDKHDFLELPKTRQRMLHVYPLLQYSLPLLPLPPCGLLLFKGGGGWLSTRLLLWCGPSYCEKPTHPPCALRWSPELPNDDDCFICTQFGGIDILAQSRDHTSTPYMGAHMHSHTHVRMCVCTQQQQMHTNLRQGLLP